MNVSFYIAKRYIKTASANNAINIISKIASFGIVIGAMALFVVLSVFSGLKEFSLSSINDFDPDLKLLPKTGKNFILTENELETIKRLPEIEFYSQIIEEKVLFLYNNKEHVALIKGVDNQYNLVNNIKKSIYQGQWLLPESPQVVVGNGICQKLSLGLYDLNYPFEVFVPKPGKGTISSSDAFNKSTLVPIGIFSVNDELDNKYVYADLKLTQELLELKSNQISSLELRLKPQTNEKAIVEKLNVLFKNKLFIKNRMQLNESLHKMLNTENAAIYLIFTLVIILTLFTLAGAIIMMILDKKYNLVTLYNIGTPIKTLKNIFLIQGTLLTFLGGVIGLFLGSAIVLVQQYYKVIMITETLAYPVVFSFTNLIIVFATILVLGFLASVIASSRVSKKMLDS